jgi:hypothetical protein
MKCVCVYVYVCMYVYIYIYIYIYMHTHTCVYVWHVKEEKTLSLLIENLGSSLPGITWYVSAALVVYIQLIQIILQCTT